MISIESRDARKYLGYSDREMEETELEEGEAYDYHDDDDENIDPDVDLSYLDEKVQAVLGHFQKDFEGGVSEENLGAKFGGYGSFLPTHQRSPSVWSQPRTPQNVQTYGIPRSPNSLAMAGESQHSAVPSAAISSVKHASASTSSAPPPVSRAQITESSSKRDSSLLTFRGTGDCNINGELVNKPNNITDQKTLKVRLKVGYDNVAKKTAAIFNDLGFPLSSPEDSPLESGGKSPEFRESPYESPTSILQIMTSSPFPDGLLLTPLPDSLLQLSEKEKLLRDNRTDLWRNYSLVDDSCSVTGEGKVLGGKNTRPVENNNKSIELKNESMKVVGNGTSAPLNLEVDMETVEGKESVADSVKLPGVSNAKFRIGDTAKSTGRVPDVSGELKKPKMKDRLLPSEFVMGDSGSVTSQDINSEEKFKQRSNVGDRVWEDRKEKACKDVQSVSGKDGKSKGNNNYESGKADFDVLKGRKELNTGAIDPPENKVKLKVTSHERHGAKLSHGADEPFSESKKKSKGSKTNASSPAIFSEESVKVVPSVAPKERRKSSGDSSSKNKPDGSKFRKEVGKARDTCRDIFGDEEIEQAENSMNSSEAHFRNAPKDYKLDVIEKETGQYADKPKDRSSGKETHQFADKSRDRPNVKKVEDSLTFQAYQKVSQNVAPVGNGHLPDMVPATVDPVLINESWVACDKCSKWRLLPPGINPDDLPKKWLCSMFHYVPGMNRCNISEDETTNIVRGLYQIPAPENQNNLQIQSNGAAARVPLPDAQSLDQKQKGHKYMSAPSGGKKKHGSKEPSDATSSMGNMLTPNTLNKNLQASLKSRSLNDVNQFPPDPNLTYKNGIQHVSKSSDSAGGKHRHRQKDKHKLARDGGVASQSKMKIKTEADQDGTRASKKIKAEGFFSTEEDWNSNHGVFTRSSGPTSVSCLPQNAFLMDMKKCGEYSPLKESKFDIKDNLMSSAKKAELVQASLDVGAPDMGRFDNRDIAAKKRKVKEWQESQDFPLEPPTHFGLHVEANDVSFEGTSEGERKRRKKARGSKSEGKEPRRSMGDTFTDKRGRASDIPSSRFRDSVDHEMEEGKDYVDKDQQQTQCRGGDIEPVDGIDPLKKDLGYGLPSLAATSSSSKISGSRKSKANFQEAKGSPVESVSSSPLRVSDKGTSARRTLLGKDDPTNVDFLANGGLRRCSDGEGDVLGGHSRSSKSEKAHSVVHRASVESSVLGYQEKDVIPTSGGKAKVPNEPSAVEHRKPLLLNGGADTVDHQRIDRVELLDKEHGNDGDQVNTHYGCNGSHSRKSGKSSSLKSKEKHKSSRSDPDKGKRKVSDSLNKQEGSYSSKKSRKGSENESRDLTHYHDEPTGGKYKLQEKYGLKGGKDERSYLGKKEHLDKWSSEGKRENQPKYAGDVGTDVKPSATGSKDGKNNAGVERSSHRSFSDRSDHHKLETVSGRGKSHLFSHSGEKQETQVRCLRPISSNHKGNETDLLPMDASTGGVGDELKVAKLHRKPDNQAGPGQNSLRHSTPGRVAASDLDGPSPVRKDSSIQAGNVALKEARDLKHSADRLKNSGSGLDGTALYFEAALKFLHGASLLEPTNAESSRHGDCQSVHIYRTTTGLCEFVAQEYERCKEMAFAALAYKCLEAACMRVVFFRHWGVDKDRHELQAALNMAPPGESPSSSASDIDNLNNQGTVDKIASAKGVGSPHVAGNHVIAARNRPSFVRVLNFTQDVISGFEASRKCQNAFAAASASSEESQCEGISSVRRAIEYNFYDVQGLLRLVRLAMEAISS